MLEPLSARRLARFGMRRGAYDGANSRRFILFTKHDAPGGHVTRHEFDTKRERDTYALHAIDLLQSLKNRANHA